MLGRNGRVWKFVFGQSILSLGITPNAQPAMDLCKNGEADHGDTQPHPPIVSAYKWGKVGGRGEEWHPVCMVTVIDDLLLKQKKKHVLSRLS
jgi:hypothetical protein